MAINLPQFRQLGAQDMGGFDLAGSLQSGFDTYSKYHEAKNKPKSLAEALLSQQLSNKINTPYAENADQMFQADLNSRQANIGATQENTLHQKILNQFLPRSEEARLGQSQAQTEYLRQGGSGAGVGTKNWNFYANQVKQDNPGLNDEQVREAANAYARGDQVLGDGTPLNPISPATKLAFDNAVKSGSTAQGINNMNLAHQSEAELDVLGKKAQEWAGRYGDTVFGHSPQLILDSFKKNDPTAQKQVGRLIAANALQFEAAQIRNRIAGGQPGITSTQQLVKESQQHIKTQFPNLTAIARKEAGERIDEAIKAGLAARSKVGYGAGSTYSKQYDTKPGGAVGEAVSMKRNGQLYMIPVKEAEKALAKGFTYD